MNKIELAKYLDSTLLNNAATKKDIEQLCIDAIKYGFKSVCINPHYVQYAKSLLKNANVLVCTVIGFPLGMNTTDTKIYETQNAVDDGADEIDMVFNVGEFLENNTEYCLKEINIIKQVCGNKTLKVIVETSQLNENQKNQVAQLILKSNADFIKTSTGFIGEGAQINDIIVWKEILKTKKFIKASGGIRDTKMCLDFIAAGAQRIGTSKAVQIINGLKDEA